MRTGVKVVFFFFFGLGSHVRIHFVCGCCLSCKILLKSFIANRRESKGTTANTEGYGQYTLRSFPYSGYYLFLSASQINMRNGGKRSRRKESSKV